MPFSQKNFRGLLQVALDHQASDIHLRTDEAPCLRIRGDLVPIQTRPFTAQDILDILRMMVPPEEYEEDIRKTDLDGGHGEEGLCRLRFNFFRYSGKYGISIRIITYKIPDMQDLKLPTIIKKIAECPRGMVLVTGITGSGKSTTLAAMIHRINQKFHNHIITIEDPIEFVHTQIKSRITQREVGIDTRSFADALRSALRQDPDVILVGEMRDLETISTAMRAAETGHTVFATVHTTDAISTIGRIISMFPEGEQDEARKRLAECLYATIGQRLLPTADGSGQVVAMEVMINTIGIQECILGKSPLSRINEIIAEGRGKSGNGSQTFDQHLLTLYEEGIISKETALEAATNQSDFLQTLLVEEGN